MGGRPIATGENLLYAAVNPDNAMNTPAENTIEQLREEAAQLEKLRQQLYSDMEVLRTQEQNLRSYEARLRGSAAPHPAPVSRAAHHEFDAEREKLARLRALLEAERRALVDERLAVRDEKAALAHKAEELKQREAWVEVREREVKAKAFAAPVPRAKPGSASPFLAAKSLFGFGS